MTKPLTQKQQQSLLKKQVFHDQEQLVCAIPDETWQLMTDETLESLEAIHLNTYQKTKTRFVLNPYSAGVAKFLGDKK